MSPIHHHFELSGWGEWKVVTVFWTAGLISGLIGLWIECISMLNYTGLENKDVLVVGLAKSGYEAAKLLIKLGANVTVNDGKDLSQDPHAKDLEALGVKIVDGGHPLSLLDNEPIIVKILVFLIQFL